MVIGSRLKAAAFNLLHKDRIEAELDAEIHAYVQGVADELIAAGVEPGEARRRACAEAGCVEPVKQAVRDHRAGTAFELFWRDGLYGMRQLRRNPTLTITVILTLALAIGANTTIFSVVWRPMRYEQPNRLRMVWETRPDGSRSNVSAGTYYDWRDQNDVFESLAAARMESAVVSGNPPTLAYGASVTPKFFDIFRLQPELGRFFSQDEFTPGKGAVAVLSYELWKTRFAGDRAILDKTVALDGMPYRVIGVAPPDFEFMGHEDIWLPLALSPGNTDRQERNLLVVGRLKPGVEAAQAGEEMRVLAERVARQSPATNKQWSARVQDFFESMAGPGVHLMFLLLLVTVSVVMCMACANVANLLLARGTTRQKEIAVRIALGARRWRIMRQLLLETLVLSVMSGGLGLLLGFAAMRYLATLPVLRAPGLAPIEINREVLVFVVLLCFAATMLAGLVPAWQTSAVNPLEQFKTAGGSPMGDRKHSRLRHALVVANLALSLVLMVTAGLSLRGLMRLAEADPGFHSDGLLTAHLSLPSTRYGDPARVQAFYSELLTKVHAIPGVQNAAISSELPPSHFFANQPFRIEGLNADPAFASFAANYQVIDGSYFRVLGLPLLNGRELSEDDRQGAARAVVVNRAFVERFFPAGNPLDRRLLIAEHLHGEGDPTSQVALEIVGIVSNLKSSGLMEPTHPQIYASYLQAPASGEYLAVRSSISEQQILESVRDALRTIDPELPLTEVSTMEERLSRPMAGGRIVVSLLVIFAFVALAMGSAGLYGVISYSASRRTAEFAMRITLGAPRREIFRLVAGGALQLLLVGGGIGAVLAFGVSQVLRRAIFGVSFFDPVVLTAVPLALLVVVLAASYLPARRAMKVDPVVALRYE
jgi:putative ABC transport system permease protein